jgi:transposase
MEFIIGESRGQIILLPDCIEDYVDDDNSVRVIEAYINSLDMAALGRSRPEPNTTGRPMHDPKDVLKLYLYGYMNRLRFSRRLETESKRNLELLWRTGGMTVYRISWLAWRRGWISMWREQIMIYAYQRRKREP